MAQARIAPRISKRVCWTPISSGWLFKAVNAVLAKYRRTDGSFETYDKLTEADRLVLKGPVTELAEDLSKLHGTLGLS